MLNLDQPVQRGAHPADAGPAGLSLGTGLLLGGLLMLAWRACRSHHHRRHSGRPAAAPAAETRWEAEGGRPLPEAGAPHT